MKILAFDPGAERCGYACIEGAKDEKPALIGSGIFGLSRTVNEESGKREEYQKYRLRLIEFWAREAEWLLNSYRPDEVATEIVPVVGGGNFVVATQSQLAATVVTVIQAVCFQNKVPVKQVGATTVKAKIGGSNKATKVKVRNGVLNLMPEQHIRAEGWKKVFDESDAFAIALTRLGYKNN